MNAQRNGNHEHRNSDILQPFDQRWYFAETMHVVNSMVLVACLLQGFVFATGVPNPVRSLDGDRNRAIARSCGEAHDALWQNEDSVA